MGSLKDSSGRVNAWTRPGSTLINGNQISTADAYVDTLQIAGRAVTLPIYVQRTADFTAPYNYVTLLAITYPNTNGFYVPVMIDANVGGAGGNRLVIRGVVIDERINEIGQPYAYLADLPPGNSYIEIQVKSTRDQYQTVYGRSVMSAIGFAR